MTKPKSPGLAGLKNPAGFIRFASSSIPLAPTPALSKPGLSDARGSVIDCAAASEVRTAAASSGSENYDRRAVSRWTAACGNMLAHVSPWSANWVYQH